MMRVGAVARVLCSKAVLFERCAQFGMDSSATEGEAAPAHSCAASVAAAAAVADYHDAASWGAPVESYTYYG